jgi:UPF0755 protein
MARRKASRKKPARSAAASSPKNFFYRYWWGFLGGVIGLLGLVVAQFLANVRIPERKTWKIPLSPQARESYSDSLRQVLPTWTVWYWLTYVTPPKAGHYELKPGEKAYQVFQRLRRGLQTPVRFYLPPQRSSFHLAAFLGRTLAYDSTAWMGTFLNYPWERYGLNADTWFVIFIPDVYEVYWTIPPESFIERMHQSYERFWNSERRQKAAALGLSPVEVTILASIVEWETSRSAEKPLIASVYLNRLRIGMPLQADPTVIYATRDFLTQRVTQRHLQVDSPYNTYQRRGLPPGPIGIPSPSSIEAVLNYTPSEYLYFCARPDGSGYHDFSVSYAEHQRKARSYQKALSRWLAQKKK